MVHDASGERSREVIELLLSETTESAGQEARGVRSTISKALAASEISRRALEKTAVWRTVREIVASPRPDIEMKSVSSVIVTVCWEPSVAIARTEQSSDGTAEDGFWGQLMRETRDCTESLLGRGPAHGDVLILEW